MAWLVPLVHYHVARPYKTGASEPADLAPRTILALLNRIPRHKASLRHTPCSPPKPRLHGHEGIIQSLSARSASRPKGLFLRVVLPRSEKIWSAAAFRKDAC